ncbi:MAG: hypothetical protein ACKOE4_08430 [Candidatus Kapaibacterium sp.]
MPILIVLVLAAVNLFSQTDVLKDQREGAEHADEARAFYESLHVVPPGYNWKVVNDAVRDQRFERRQTMRMQMVDDVVGRWTEVGSVNQAGRVVAVEYDNATGRVWLAGAGGTIWSGDTTGKTWTCHTDERRIEDPQYLRLVRRADKSEALVVVSRACRVWVLDLTTKKWSQATGLTEMQRWGSFENAVSCVRDGRLEIHAVGNEWDYSPAWKARSVWYRSIDSGKSFQRLRWIDGEVQIWSDGGKSVWLYHSDSLSSVEPSGSLSLIAAKPFSSIKNLGRVMLAGPSADYVMAACPRSDTTTFMMSVDGGRTWTKQGGVQFGPFDVQSFGYAHENGQWLYGGVDTYKSGDDGTQWFRVNGWGEYYGDPVNKLHADIPAIIGFPSGVTFVCTDGGMYISRTGGNKVRNVSLRNLNISQYYGSFTSRDNVQVVSAGAQDQGFQRSRLDSGGVRSFQQMISGDYSNLVSGDGGASLFCVYPGFTMYIPNHEDGWEPRGQDFKHKGHLWLPPLTVGSSKPDEAWLGGGTNTGKGAYVYRYTPGADKLKIDSLPFDFGEGASDVRITALAFAPSNDNVCYVVTSAARVWRTTNRGLTWTKLTRPDKITGHYFSGNALCVAPVNPARVLIGGSGYDGPGVYASDDAGATFTALPGLPPCLVMSLATTTDARYIAAATDVGAFVYDTETKVWTDVTDLGAPDQVYWHVDRVEPLGIFRFSTYGRGLWDFVITGTTTVAERRDAAASSPIASRGIVMNGTSYLELNTDIGRTATLSWYELEGRRHAQSTIDLASGTTRITRPATHANAGPLTAVITTASGQVSGCVVP